jgi:hypothetical protein
MIQKRQIFLLLVMTISLMATKALSTENFGRLFTTPAQRAELDYLRKTTKIPVAKLEETEEFESTATKSLPSAVSMQGYVKRGDGKKGTVWINNTPVQENSSTSELQVGKLGSENRVEVKIPANGKRLSLKAGQVYDPETNAVLETSAHAKEREMRNLQVDELIKSDELPTGNIKP